MKKAFTFLSILLAMVFIVSLCAVNASAYNYAVPVDFVPWEYEPQTLDGEHSAVQKAIELYGYCDTLCTYFDCYAGVEKGFDRDIWGFVSDVDGGMSLHYDNDSLQPLVQAVRKVYVEVYRQERTSGFAERATDAFFLSYYDELKEAAKQPQVSYRELGWLIERCEKEDNDSDFYTAEVWEPFTAALNSAREAYNANTVNGTEPDTGGSSQLYWELYFAYNRLCMQISVPGDIDGDGEADIIDVTIMQRSLAGIIPALNSAQCCAGCVQDISQYGKELYPDIIDVTMLQRSLAQMDVLLNNRILPERYAACLCYDINPIVANDMRVRYFFWYYD